MAGLASYKRRIQAGQSSTVGARGKTIVLRDVVGEVRITARSNQLGSAGGQAYTLTMRKFEKWFCPEEFDAVEVFNDSADTLVVELLIGYGDYVREVTSRTIASKYIYGTRKTFGTASEYQSATLLPENLQRKRAIITAAGRSGSGAAIAVGQAIDLDAFLVERSGVAASIDWENGANNYTGFGFLNARGVEMVDALGTSVSPVAAGALVPNNTAAVPADPTRVLTGVLDYDNNGAAFYFTLLFDGAGLVSMADYDSITLRNLTTLVDTVLDLTAASVSNPIGDTSYVEFPQVAHLLAAGNAYEIELVPAALVLGIPIGEGMPAQAEIETTAEIHIGVAAGASGEFHVLEEVYDA